MRLAVSDAPYRGDPAIGVVCAYFNPAGYARRLANLLAFLDRFAAGGVEVVVAEGRMPGAAPLPDDLPARVLPVPCDEALWQKERLLNLALAALPLSCRYVAWVDGDLLFEDPDWLLRAAAALEREHAGFLQPFDTVYLLPRDPRRGRPLAQRGYAWSVADDPRRLAASSWSGHGNTGYAWVGRMDVLRRAGFYDRCIIGSGDHVMAHAMTATTSNGCVETLLGPDGPHRDDYRKWAAAVEETGWTRTTYLPGTALHLWHGDPSHRRYLERNLELRRYGFDPGRDLVRSPSGGWRFADERRDLSQWAAEYFRHRREDG